MVQELWQQDDLVRTALLANALGTLGEASGQHSITVHGWRVYGSALQMLGQALPAKIKENGDQVLTASMLLAQYEVRKDASPQLWFRELLRSHSYYKGREVVSQFQPGRGDGTGTFLESMPSFWQEALSVM